MQSIQEIIFSSLETQIDQNDEQESQIQPQNDQTEKNWQDLPSIPKIDGTDYESLKRAKENGVDLSKNQLKKLKRFENWEANREAHKKALKEKKRDKKRKLCEAKQQDSSPLTPALNSDKETLSSLETNPSEKNEAKKKKNRLRMSDPNSSQQRIVIDVDQEFINSMLHKVNEISILSPISTNAGSKYFKKLTSNCLKNPMKDVFKLLLQVRRCYSVNRNSSSPFQLYVTGMGDKLKQLLEKSFDGFKQWDLYFHDDSFSKVFEETPKEKIVYLTPDSPNLITTLHPDSIYIIGGLVDHNSLKSICYEKAKKLGIAHGQLPIGEYFQLSQRKVLTVNHVFEILTCYHQLKDWKEAFRTVIPSRKGLVPKTNLP
eukprot:Sdes_comp20780_c0_seq3m16857